MSEELSKSAKKRLAKKNRDAAAEAENPPVADVKPKAAAKSNPEPEPKAKAKAKAQPKATAQEAKTETAPKAAPKSQSAPKAEAKKAPEKPKEQPKSAAKAAAKGKAKAKPEPVEEAEPERKGPEILTHTVLDDGKGGDWEVSSGLTKKQQKQKDAKKQREDEAKAMGFANSADAMKQLAKAQMIPGFNLVEAGKAIPGASQSVAAGPGLIARIQAEAAARVQAGQAVEVTEVKTSANSSTVQIPCPPEKIGRIVGPKGATLKMITEKTGVDRIDTTDGMVTIIGEVDAVKRAEVACKEMIEKGFMSLAFDNFNESTVMVHPVHFPNLIGQKGAIIMKLKSELNVEVTIPQGITKDSKGSWGKKKYPLTIAGSSEKVEKAKEVINDIVYYSHHPITHEGVIHEELEIEEWLYKFLIGPKGSEMRHIQNSFKVAVNIPRDNVKDTGCNPNVLIVGEQQNVERAKKHIEKVLYAAEHDTGGGRGREDKAMGDDRDNDDAVDPIAAQYLYKRR